MCCHRCRRPSRMAALPLHLERPGPWRTARWAAWRRGRRWRCSTCASALLPTQGCKVHIALHDSETADHSLAFAGLFVGVHFLPIRSRSRACRSLGEPLHWTVLIEHCHFVAGLIEGVESRAAQPDYARLLKDLQVLYCETRLGLLGGVVDARVRKLAAKPLQQLLRGGCAYLMQASSTRIGTELSVEITIDFTDEDKSSCTGCPGFDKTALRCMESRRQKLIDTP